VQPLPPTPPPGPLLTSQLTTEDEVSALATYSDALETTKQTLEPVDKALDVVKMLNQIALESACGQTIPYTPELLASAWKAQVDECVKKATEGESNAERSGQAKSPGATSSENETPAAQSENASSAESQYGSELSNGNAQAQSSQETGTVSESGNTDVVQTGANENPGAGVATVAEASVSETTSTCTAGASWCSELSHSSAGPCNPGEGSCGIPTAENPAVVDETTGKLELGSSSQLPSDQVGGYVVEPGTDASAAVSSEEGLSSVTASLPGEADTSLVDISNYGKVGSFLEGGSDAFGVVGVAIGGVGVVNDLVQGNYQGATTGIISTTLNVYTGMALEPVDLVIIEGSAVLGDGPGIVLGVVAVVALNVGAGAGVTWVSQELSAGVFAGIAWLESSLFDIYAPDVFVDNATGRTQDLEVSVGTQGTYDVRPGFTDAARGSWSVASEPAGGLVVGGVPVADLHYEMSTAARWQYARGWTVPRAGFAQWAASTLAAYGFDRTAIGSFERTWSGFALGGGDLAVYPQSGALLQSVEPMRVSPPSASVGRVWFVVEPSPGGHLVPPVIAPRQRRALDVEEWGVVPTLGAYEGSLPK